MIQIILFFWILTQLNAPSWIWGAYFVWATVKIISIIQKVFKKEIDKVKDFDKKKKSFQERLIEMADEQDK